MKSRIFTPREREILRVWLEQGLKLEGFKVLMYYIRKNHKTVEEDYVLLREVLKRMYK